MSLRLGHQYYFSNGQKKGPLVILHKIHDKKSRQKVKKSKRCPRCPFVLYGLVLSLLSLKSPFCPVLCPSFPSHKRLKFAATVLFLSRFRTVNMTKRVCRDCPIPNCGAKYLVRLSNHLTDVHGLDYINRRKWLQEAKFTT